MAQINLSKTNRLDVKNSPTNKKGITFDENGVLITVDENKDIEVVTQGVFLEQVSFSNEPLTPGTSLVIGSTYGVVIDGGDDFSNVGYIQDYYLFDATNTTPNSWTTSRVYKIDNTVLKNSNNLSIIRKVYEEDVMGVLTMSLEWDLSNLDSSKTLVIPTFTETYTKSPHKLLTSGAVSGIKSLIIYYV
jgi:hypothetical protein